MSEPTVSMPVVSDIERAELLALLKEAQADIAAGEFIELGEGQIEPWLNEILSQAKREKYTGRVI